MLADQRYDGHRSIHDDAMAEKLGLRAGPISVLLGSSGQPNLRSRGPAVGLFAGQEMKAPCAAFDREAAEPGRGA